MELASIHLDGKAEVWFQGFAMDKKEVSWNEFVERICSRFGNIRFNDVVGGFNKLKQFGTVKQYQEKFEDSWSLMLAENPYFTENYFVSSFISGLQVDLKSMVRLLKPATLLAAYE